MKRLFAALTALVLSQAAFAGPLSEVVEAAQTALKQKKPLIRTEQQERATAEFRALFPVRTSDDNMNYMLNQLQGYTMIGTTRRGEAVLIDLNNDGSVLEVSIARKVNSLNKIGPGNQTFLNLENESRDLSFQLDLMAKKTVQRPPNESVVASFPPEGLIALDGQKYFLQSYQINKATRIEPKLVEKILSKISGISCSQDLVGFPMHGE